MYFTIDPEEKDRKKRKKAVKPDHDDELLDDDDEDTEEIEFELEESEAVMSHDEKYQELDPRLYAILQAPHKTHSLLPPGDALLLGKPHTPSKGKEDIEEEEEEEEDETPLAEKARASPKPRPRERPMRPERPPTDRGTIKPRYGPKVAAGDLIDPKAKERVEEKKTISKAAPIPKRSFTRREEEYRTDAVKGPLHRSDSPLYIPGVASVNMTKCPQCGSFMNLTASKRCYVCGYVVGR